MSIRSSDTPIYLMGKPVKGGLPTAGQVLQFNAVADYWEAVTLPPGTPHDLLDGSVDQDTVAAAVQSGDMIFGNATPLWDRLPKGGAGSILNISAANLPAWLAAGTNGYLLVMVAGAPAWVSFGASSGYLKGGNPPTIQTGIPLADLLNAGGAAGDIIYWDGANFVRLAVGANGDILTLVAGVPAWVTPVGTKALTGIGGNTTIANTVGTVTYLPFTGFGGPDATENNVKTPMPYAATIKNAYINVSTNASTVATTWTLRKNGVDTAIVITMTALTTGVFSDTSNTVTVAAGDVLNWKASAATTGVVNFSGSLTEVDPL